VQHLAVAAVKFWKRYANAGRNRQRKHQYLRECIIAAIRDEFWELGEKLPPEADLARVTPFSLGTVQKAFRDLAAAGFVERRQGAGTFVAYRPKSVEQPWNFRFRGDGPDEFLPVFPRLDRVSRRPGDGPWLLYLDGGESKLVQIDRVVDIGHEFLLFSQFFIDARVYDEAVSGGRKLEGVDFRRELGLAITSFSNDVRADVFPAAICAKIKVPAGTVGTILDVRASAADRRQRYFQRAFIPPSRRWLHLAQFDPNTISRLDPAPASEARRAAAAQTARE